MSQILHIFRKDIRHVWIDTVASLMLLGVYTWQTIHGWSSPEAPFGVLAFLWRTVPPLVPISWCWLIVRVVHDESLVGDRQFWVTRPYDWRQLLAAKAFFALAFINLPLFIADVILLDKAGFSPLHHLPGLLWMQLLMVLFLVMPAVTLCAVTATFVQLLLSILALALYLAAVAGLVSLVPNSDMPMGSDAAGNFAFVIFVAICLASIFLQFARRRTLAARLSILSAGAAILLVSVLTPYGTLFNQAFPRVSAGQAPPAQLTMLPADPAVTGTDEPNYEDGKAILDFPVQVAGVSSGNVVVADGVLITIQAPDGRRWTSHWQTPGNEFWPSTPKSFLKVDVDRRFFEQVQLTSVHVSMSVALTSYRETKSRDIVAKAGEFDVPGIGVCWIDKRQFWGNRWITCRSPLKKPGLMAHMESAASTCRPEVATAISTGTGYNWDGTGDSDFADFGISPVQDFSFSFEHWSGEDGRSVAPGICSGTLFTVSTPEVIQHTRIEYGLDGVRLRDYVTRPFRF